MRPQQFLIPLASFAFGVLVTCLVRNEGSGGGNVDVVDGSRGKIAASKLDYERRIAELNREIENMRNRGASGPLNPETSYSVTATNAPASIQSMKEAIEGSKESVRTKIRNMETDVLLAAGFPLQRIEWLRRRTDELKTERDRLTREGKITDRNLAMAYLMDPDLDLAIEIGEDEYDRYRRALGRPPGVIVEEVRNGTPAKDAGLRPGDVIVGYSGKRIYNTGTMDVLIEAQSSGGNVPLDVIRDGRKVQIVAPSGWLQFTSKHPVIYQMENHETKLGSR